METNAHKNQKCPHCGALMREYWHTLTPGLVSALVKLHRAVRWYGRNRIHIHNEMKSGVPPEFRLTDNEWTNFTKLRFHALAAKCDDGGNRKSGYWLLTRRGGQFLRGKTAVPLKTKTYRNSVKERSEELVTIRDFRGKVSWFEREFEYEIAAPEPASMPKVEIPAIPVAIGMFYRFRSEICEAMPSTLFDYGKR